jgi:hypothetical protein
VPAVSPNLSCLLAKTGKISGKEIRVVSNAISYEARLST